MKSGTPKSYPRAFRWLAGILPLLLPLAVEGCFRWRGFGGYPATLKPIDKVEGGQLVLADQAGAASWFFANRDRPGFNESSTFIHPKPPNTFRVFMLGESAMKGYPQPRNLASSSFLQAMLQDAWPHRRIEVINLGTTAVASYPVRGMLEEALAYEPDLVIIHTGHNEFFGTYGVASIGRVGGSTTSLALTRFVHSLATVQAYHQWRDRHSANRTGLTLMEIMSAESQVPADDPRRAVATRNLHDNLAAMARACRQHQVPVIACTLPSNERDLAPIGHAPDADNPALRHYQTGRRLLDEGKPEAALAEFVRARDLDTMPWRAPSAANNAVQQAAREQGAVLCDLEQRFRAASPDGIIGWLLMDDHVHPTLRGQALMAEGFVDAMAGCPGHARLDAPARAKILPWEHYAERLGANPFDAYGVSHSMRVLFDVPFMRASNPEAHDRLQRICTDFEHAADPDILPILLEWQTCRPHAGAKRPLSGMVARVFMRRRNIHEALRYFDIARMAVPEYTSWHMEYVYFGLACRQILNGDLTAAEQADAMKAIDQGKLILGKGFAASGLTERHIGRLYQLCGRDAEAIPFLLASRRKLSGSERVAADQALFTAYLKTGKITEASGLVRDGSIHAGKYAPVYQALGRQLQTRAAPAR